MDPFSAKQARINREKQRAVAQYPLLWSKMIAEWSLDGANDLIWVMYSANYLLRTGGIRWAIDPYTLQSRVPESNQVDGARDLDKLSFILLTHSHSDHIDFSLLRALRTSSARWVIPEYLLPSVIERTQVAREKIIVPRPLEPLRMDGMNGMDGMDGMTILPFDGLHWDVRAAPDAPLRGMPAMGYLIEFKGRRWLFPGDTRTYDAGLLPSFGPVDILFAHLWLGRSSALLDEPPLLESFCRFCVDLQPRCLVVTHLREFGRDAVEYWDREHYRKVFRRLRAIAPRIRVLSAGLGKRLAL